MTRLIRKKEKDLSYHELKEFIPFMDEKAKGKIEFARNLLIQQLQIDNIDDCYVSLSKTKGNRILYLLFSILVEYDRYNNKKTEENFEDFMNSQHLDAEKNEIPEETRGKQEHNDDLYYIEIGKLFPSKPNVENRESEFTKSYLLSRFNINEETEDDVLIVFSAMNIKEMVSLIRDVVESYEKYE